MTRFSLRLLAPAVALLLAVANTSASAQDLAKEAFYGHFQGSGVAENSDSLYFGVTVRDLDVRIGAEAPGFFVEWTSVIRGGGDPGNPDVKRRTARMSFVPSAEPGIFNATGARDPRGASGLGWASISGQTLSVHVMRITDSGGYVIQTYDRTLEGTGMRLQFVNVANGEPRRQVDARLVKVGN
ncbi:MAG: hypothetical protein JJ899_16600 [Alphaproteobacteria bacterium]|nr:hypothetical protein [Alphaproteobacteria bacterium]